MDQRLEQLEQLVASQSKEIADLKRQQATSSGLQHLDETKKLASSMMNNQLPHLNDNMSSDLNSTSPPHVHPPTSQLYNNTVPQIQLGGPPLFTTLSQLPKHPYSMNPLVHPSNAIPPTVTKQVPAQPSTPTNGFLKPSKLTNRFSMPASNITFPTSQIAPQITSLVSIDAEELSEEDSDEMIDTRRTNNKRMMHSLLERNKPTKLTFSKPNSFCHNVNFLAKLQSQSPQKVPSNQSNTEQTLDQAIYVSCPVQAENGDDLKHYKLGGLTLANSLQKVDEVDYKFYPIMVTIGPDGRFQRLPSDTSIKEPKFRLNKSDKPHPLD